MTVAGGEGTPTRRELRRRRREAEATAAEGAESFSLSGAFAAQPGAEAEDDAPATPPSILFVCTGNICRSAMAHAVLGTRLADFPAAVSSAGTHALVGDGMPRDARAVAAEQGASEERIEAHHARLLTEAITDSSTLIIAMNAEHLRAALGLVPRAMHRVFSATEFARLASTVSDEQVREAADAAGEDARNRFAAAVQLIAAQRGIAPRTGEDADVVDPFRRPREVYEQSAAQLMPAVDAAERLACLALVSDR